MGNRTKLFWLFAGALVAIGVVLVVFASRSSQTVVDLHVSLTKLKIASSSHISLNDYSTLVIEARSRFELAKPRLSGEQIAACDRGVSAAEQTIRVWEIVDDNPVSAALLEDALGGTGAVFEKKDIEATVIAINGVSAVAFVFPERASELTERARMLRQKLLSEARNGAADRLTGAIQSLEF